MMLFLIHGIMFLTDGLFISQTEFHLMALVSFHNKLFFFIFINENASLLLEMISFSSVELVHPSDIS